jgi:hypothetical protein
MVFDQGKLEKMTIRELLPQSDPSQPQQVSEEVAYVVQVNPSSYTLNHVLHYTHQQGQGFSGSEATYNQSEPTTLTFEFLFDGTGVVVPHAELGEVPVVGAIASALPGKKDDFIVTDEIEKFNQVVYAFEGEIHRPRQILLIWGDFLAFPCVLTSLSYNFTLFKPDGSPLRAVAKCSFQESISDAERERRDNASSPDLTHLRDVKQGDTLPLMSHRIYGKPDFYLEVARVNKVVNFRRLQAGTRLAFPPISKEVKP